MSRNNIYLVGFMGTGKTTVGMLLSSLLKREFVETDGLIEAREGTSIVDIFDRKGEAYFRACENNVLKELSCRSDLVVSCGGGMITQDENIGLLKESGVTVCLKATPQTVYQRTKQHTERPLLNVADPVSRIKTLLQERAPYYEKADYSIETDTLTPQEVAARITRMIGDC